MTSNNYTKENMFKNKQRLSLYCCLVAIIIILYACEVRTIVNIKSDIALNELKLPIDAASLYLDEKYLRLLHLAFIDHDSKEFVDRPTKKPLNQVLDALNRLDETNLTQIRNFTQEFFYPAGHEIVIANFTDWNAMPKYIETIKSPALKNFSLSINNLWLSLYKKFDPSLLGQDSVSSHLPLKNPFIVPGGRFLEMYYWDNYWIIQGLLVSGMYDTCVSLFENLMFLIQQYGFIPNGSRIYYLNRSQPPYFALMVMDFYKHVHKSTELSSERKLKYKRFVLEKALDSIKAEYNFWMEKRVVKIMHKGNELRLNIFNPTNAKPRPESYVEDILTARSCGCESTLLYKNIAAAAETGIDFSSRWMNDSMRIQSIYTSDIVPVDLNALMYKIETIISILSSHKKDFYNYRLYRKYAMSRRMLINTLMWSNKLDSWADFNLQTKTLNDNAFYVTNLSPLFMDIKPINFKISDMIKKHFDILNQYEGGVPFSMINSTQQWDFANVWAPTQHSIVMTLLKYDRDLALVFAKRFFNSVYLGWLKNGLIYEKYSAIKLGERGEGGEYKTATGFGWTNGAILTLIGKFKDELI